MIRCIIFDLDGTLVHSLPGIAASLNRVLESATLPTHPESAVRGFIGNGIRKLVQRAAPELDSENLDRLVTAMRDDYARSWKDGTLAYPGVVETLEALVAKAIPITVFSNKPDEYCREITDHIFPEIPFPIVRGLMLGVPAKPSPEGALKICQELDIPPQGTAFVGDSTIDLKTAHSAEMIAIAATWGYHDPPALAEINPHHTIHTMDELIPALNI